MASRFTTRHPPSALQSAAEQAARATGGASSHTQTAPAPTGSSHAGTNFLLALSALGLLGIAWGFYSGWWGSSKPIAEGPAETKVPLERLAAAPGKSPTHPAEPTPIRSEQPAFEQANAQTQQHPHEPDEPFAPCVEPVTEQSVLQALDEPDEETRYQRLQETIGSGAEIPLDRMHEVLETDPSDKVRELALNALTEHPDASAEEIRAVAESALANTSLAVRTHAARILEQMNGLERIDKESRKTQLAM